MDLHSAPVSLEFWHLRLVTPRVIRPLVWGILVKSDNRSPWWLPGELIKICIFFSYLFLAFHLHHQRIFPHYLLYMLNCKVSSDPGDEVNGTCLAIHLLSPRKTGQFPRVLPAKRFWRAQRFDFTLLMRTSWARNQIFSFAVGYIYTLSEWVLP